MQFIRHPGWALPQLYAGWLDNALMKIPTPHTAFVPRAARGFGQIALVLLFLLSVFQLTHGPGISTDQNWIDLWRSVAVGSLFLFFCFPATHR